MVLCPAGSPVPRTGHPVVLSKPLLNELTRSEPLPRPHSPRPARAETAAVQDACGRHLLQPLGGWRSRLLSSRTRRCCCSGSSGLASSCLERRTRRPPGPGRRCRPARSCSSVPVAGREAEGPWGAISRLAPWKPQTSPSPPNRPPIWAQLAKIIFIPWHQKPTPLKTDSPKASRSVAKLNSLNDPSAYQK